MPEIKCGPSDVKPVGNLELTLFTDKTWASPWALPFNEQDPPVSLLIKGIWRIPVKCWEDWDPNFCWPLSKLGLRGLVVVCTAMDVCMWSPYAAVKNVFGVQTFLVARRLPSARSRIWLGVNFRVRRGRMPKNMLSSASWPPSSECWLLLGGDGSCLERGPFLPFGFLPSPGVRAGRGGPRYCGREGWELLEEHLGLESVVSLKKIYPFGLVCGSN